MEISLRAAAVFFFLYAVMRVLGRRELAQMTPFELILLVIMGDLIQQAVVEDDTSIIGAVIAVSTLALLILAMSYASFRWKRAADVLEGRPTIVVHRGRPDMDALRMHRVTLEEVQGAARQQGIASLAQVELGILEPEGKLSFVLADRRTHAGPPEIEGG